MSSPASPADRYQASRFRRAADGPRLGGFSSDQTSVSLVAPFYPAWPVIELASAALMI